MIPEGQYGAVKITGGAFAGRVGYYDDDESSRMAIVYWGAPVFSPYALVPRRLLEPATNDEYIAARGWVRD